jgi:hypothetical protein
MIFSYISFIKENIKHQYKFYKNIDNIVDGEPLVYYNVPFELGEKGIGFSDTEDWKHYLGNQYVYDYIKDIDIKEALKEDLSNINISVDWTSIKEDDIINNISAYQNKNKHSLRIAKLVKEMLDNKPIRPVSMFFDAMSYNYDIKNNIEDGNHRIRALQYLKYDGFPAYIYGGHSKYLIEYLNQNI